MVNRMLPLFDAGILLLIAVELVPLLCSNFIFVKQFYLNVTTAPQSNASTVVDVSQGGHKLQLLLLLNCK